MVCTLGGGAGDLGASTINAKNINDRPPSRCCRRSGSAHHQHKKHRRWALWEAMTEIRERPPSTQTMSMAGPLGGGAGDPRVPTMNTKMSMMGPLEVVPEIWERPASTQKTSTADPLGGDAGDPGTPTINTKNIDNGCDRTTSEMRGLSP
jgi:hypothetical protein